MSISATRWRVVVSLLAVVLWTATIWVTSRHGGVARTYGASSPTLAVLDLFCGGGVLAVGVRRWWQERVGSTGPLLIALGTAWLAVDWSGWDAGPAGVRTVATLIGPFSLACVVHLAWCAHTPRATRSPFPLAGYLLTGLFVGFWALGRDPLRDRYCWNNCTANVLLVKALPVVNRTVTTAWLWLSALGGLGVAAWCIVELMRSSSSSRRLMALLLAPLALVAAACGTRAALLLAVPVEDPSRPIFVVVFVLQAASLGLLAVGALASSAVDHWRIRALGLLVEDLGEAPSPGSLRTALASSLGDDSLDIVYWLADLGRYVDGSGATMELGAGNDRVSTPIVRGGRTIAVVLHDPALAMSRDVLSEIGAAARLVVDNERLRAEALAQLADLRASRARIIDAADRERRALERNLHDGAQQRMLALSYQLRLAESRIRNEGAHACADRVVEATMLAGRVVAALRELAHGIHPVVLEEAGLGAALATVADTAPLVVRITRVPVERLEFQVELTAYLVVCAAIADASRAHAEMLTVSLVHSASSMDVELIADRTLAVFDEMGHAADRVGALGGWVEMSATTTLAVIPCAS